MSEVMRTSLFSATAKGGWSYHFNLSVHSIPHFLHISQCTRRATLSWRFLYSLWASLLHPLIICLTVSVEFSHNLHNGVSEFVSILCLIEFVLKACSWAARIKPSVSFFKNPFLSHLQESSPATSAVCRTNSPCRAFSFQFLIFSSCFLSGIPGDSLLHLIPSPSRQLEASTLWPLWDGHAGTYSPSLHTPQFWSALFLLPSSAGTVSQYYFWCAYIHSLLKFS